MDPATLYMIAMLADGSMRVSSDHFEDREPCEVHAKQEWQGRQVLAWCVPDRKPWVRMAPSAP